MTTKTSCPCNANGYDTCEVADIVKAECLDCGYSTTDHTTILMWNGYGDHVGLTDRDCVRSAWTNASGDVLVIDDTVDSGERAVLTQTPEGVVYVCDCGHVSRTFAERPASDGARMADTEGAARRSAAAHLVQHGGRAYRVAHADA